jgi:pyruvate,water dikinase
LNKFGMRGIAEIDLGRPRWRDDPAAVLQTLQSYLQLEDPSLAPDRIYQQGFEQADHLASQYIDRVRKMRFGNLRAWMLSELIRRIRTLGALREVPLFYLAHVFDLYRAALLSSARELVAAGELECDEDIFFVPLNQLKHYSQGEKIDLREIVAAQRAIDESERERKQMPRVLLSTGEAFYEGIRAVSTGENVLNGQAVSPGSVEGQARVILDPRGAHLEPGEILVCPSTDPGWTPLFLTAGGLVMEIGGLITHGQSSRANPGCRQIQNVTGRSDRQCLRVDGNLESDFDRAAGFFRCLKREMDK